MNLTINNNKATTDTKFGFVEYSKIKSRFEGRTSLLKDGKFAFEATPHNLEFWRSRFPDSEINHLTIDNSQKSIDTPRFEFQFKREPMPHQQKAFDKFKSQKYTAIFGDVGSGKSKTFKIMLNAAYVGKFYLSTVGCEAMYDNSINSRKPGRWVEVSKAE